MLVSIVSIQRSNVVFVVLLFLQIFFFFYKGAKGRGG